jgi:hypothetical protein
MPRSADKSWKVALLVGVNRYDKRGFAEQPLNYAERDVEHLKTELEKAGFKVTLLTGSARGNLRAFRANIDQALDETLQGLNASDIVLMAFAGHGQQVGFQGQEDAFFCPCDAEKNAPQTMVSMTELLGKLDRKGGTNLVLVDACRDDPTRGGVRAIEGNELQGRLPANTAVLFSCAARQQAFETEQAGGGHGIFFHFVLEGLRGKAKDEDGKVTWDDLVRYVHKNVNPAAQAWFPDRAKIKADSELQTPHELRNLVRMPVLADLGRGSTDIGKVERADVPKPDTGKGSTDPDKVERNDSVPPSQNVQYLSDMQEFDVKVYRQFAKKGTLGFAEGDPRYANGRIRVNGKESPNGLAMHALSNTYATVKYTLGNKAHTFMASVTLNDSAGAPGRPIGPIGVGKIPTPLTFQVLGDGKVLWSSKPLDVARNVQDCQVDVSRVNVLELRVDCPGSYVNAQAVWFEPRVLLK